MRSTSVCGCGKTNGKCTGFSTMAIAVAMKRFSFSWTCCELSTTYSKSAIALDAESTCSPRLSLYMHRSRSMFLRKAADWPLRGVPSSACGR